MSSGNGHRTETPDVSHIRNVEVTHEASDVNVGAILKFVVILTVLTIAISIGLWFMFKYFDAQEAKQRPPGPMSLRNLNEAERLPPEPRLQVQRGFEVKLEDGTTVPLALREPQAEYRELRKQWENVLANGMKDQSGNTVVMPIEQAMKQVVSGQGLPTSAQQGPAKLQDWAISMPTDTSSGRESMKKLQ